MFIIPNSLPHLGARTFDNLSLSSLNCIVCTNYDGLYPAVSDTLTFLFKKKSCYVSIRKRGIEYRLLLDFLGIKLQSQ